MQHFLKVCFGVYEVSSEKHPYHWYKFLPFTKDCYYSSK